MNLDVKVGGQITFPGMTKWIQPWNLKTCFIQKDNPENLYKFRIQPKPYFRMFFLCAKISNLREQNG